MCDVRRWGIALLVAAVIGAEDAPAPAPAPLELNLRQTLVEALARNRQLRVQHLGPAISATAIVRQQAAFDPAVAAQVGVGRTETRTDGLGAGRVDTLTTTASLSQTLATGTSWSVDGSTTHQRSDLYGDTAVTSRAGLTINQALLQGSSTAANLVAVNQARVDLDISRYELRGYTLALVAEVESAYWDHALAEQQVAITTQALTVARQQLEQIRSFIATGKLAGVEIAAAEAEVAVRNGFVIEARSQQELSRLHLLTLIDPPGPASLERPLTLVDRPFVPELVMDGVATHVAVALRLRPDLNQARLQAARGDLTLVRTRNGLLPRLDLFATLGRTGYGETFRGSLGSEDGRGWDGEIGARFAYTLGNRAATADHHQALLTREQLGAALANQEHLAEVDVRGAIIELDRARQQIDATAVTVRAQAEKARAEREKFLSQKSTSLLVAQAERDELASRLDEARTVVRYLKDLVDLYRLDGSLLERRGIAIPGADPQSSVAPTAP